MKWIFCLLLTLFVFTTTLFGQSKQTLLYKVLWKGDSVGFVKANRLLDKNGEATYDLHTNTTFNLLIGKISLDYFYNLEYKNDRLMKATTDGYLNGRERSKAFVQHNGSGYEMKIDGDDEYLSSKGEDMTISRMYFNEPSNYSEVFCERLGKYCQLDNLGNHSYRFNRPSGRANTYHYENNICTSAEMNYRFVTIYIELIEKIDEEVPKLTVQSSSF